MLYDIIAFTVSVLMMVTYYLYLIQRSRRVPDSSVHALNARIREQWVDMVIHSKNRDILAVQTLRNSVMAANFMASTAVLLIIGTLNISEKIAQWALNWHPYALANDVYGELWQIKLGLLLLDFSIAFYCFSMAIRLFNHVGYMINLSDDGSIEGGLHKKTCAYLNKAGSYYSFGTRTFFFSLPIVLWFFGPYSLVLATLALIAGLAMLDKVPS
ncbi:MAG: DUF599 domain-containing protein [Methylococcaceae bacterium]|nr:DUF599 domain-containing protein [Methylococcaceae bacterium]